LLQVALADPAATAEGLRSTCEELLALSRQQERLIESLLTLASSEQEVDRWDTFDLATVAEVVISGRQQEADRRHITLETRLAPTPAAGDRGLVEILVANLVDNAIRHNVDGGWVEVATAAAAGRVTLRVVNTGAAIPVGEVTRLFQPFQRLGPARTAAADGHGLGLAIVSAIAAANRATVSGSPRPGGGLAIEVSLLGAAAPPASRAVEASAT
jgi:signal transduction histidine kinase